MFNFLPLVEYFLSSSEKDIFGCQIAQALMIPPCIVVGDELLDPAFELTGQIVIFQQDLVIQ